MFRGFNHVNSWTVLSALSWRSSNAALRECCEWGIDSIYRSSKHEWIRSQVSWSRFGPQLLPLQPAERGRNLLRQQLERLFWPSIRGGLADDLRPIWKRGL